MRPVSLRRATLLRRNKRYRHWSSDLDGLTRRRQSPGYQVNSEDENVVRTLVRRQQPSASRINTEASGRLSLGRNILEIRQLPGLLINRVNGNRIMATIGAVEKLPRRMNEQFRSAVATLDRLPRRQRRYRFRRSKRTCLRGTNELYQFVIIIPTHLLIAVSGQNLYFFTFAPIHAVLTPVIIWSEVRQHILRTPDEFLERQILWECLQHRFHVQEISSTDLQCLHLGLIGGS